MSLYAPLAMYRIPLSPRVWLLVSGSFLQFVLHFVFFSTFIELVASSESDSCSEDNEFMEMQNVIALSLQETQ